MSKADAKSFEVTLKAQQDEMQKFKAKLPTKVLVWYRMKCKWEAHSKKEAAIFFMITINQDGTYEIKKLLAYNGEKLGRIEEGKLSQAQQREHKNLLAQSLKAAPQKHSKCSAFYKVENINNYWADEKMTIVAKDGVKNYTIKLKAAESIPDPKKILNANAETALLKLFDTTRELLNIGIPTNYVYSDTEAGLDQQTPGGHRPNAEIPKSESWSSSGKGKPKQHEEKSVEEKPEHSGSEAGSIDGGSPPKERSRSRSHSPAKEKSRSRSGSPAPKEGSRSVSPAPKERSRSGSPAKERSRSRSGSPAKKDLDLALLLKKGPDRALLPKKGLDRVLLPRKKDLDLALQPGVGQDLDQGLAPFKKTITQDQARLEEKNDHVRGLDLSRALVQLVAQSQVPKKVPPKVLQKVPQRRVLDQEVVQDHIIVTSNRTINL